MKSLISSDSNNKLKSKIIGIIRRDIFITFLSVVGVSLILLGNSYALFTSFNSSKDYNYVNIGTLRLEYSDININKSLNLTDSLPMTDEEGLMTDGYVFSLTNTGTLPSKYVIKLVDDINLIELDNCKDNLLPKNFIKVSLNNSVPVLLSDLKESDYIIGEGVLAPGEKKVYSLKSWLDSQSDNTIFGKKYYGKLLVEGFKDDTQISIGKVKDILLDSSRLGPDGKIITNDNEQIFLAGSNPNNYVWYSGKLWRVVSLDNDGNAKMVTNDIVTVIPYGNSNQEFINTFAYQWLNNDFYNSLKNPDKYLLEFDYSIDKVSSSAKPNGRKKSFKVGLLHPYEYSMTNNHGNYLNINMTYALLPYINNSNIWIINNKGELINQDSSLYIGIRPTINLNKDIDIVGGKGTVNDPYRLSGDNEKYLANSPLNSRYSGEYVNFNDMLFRIVSINNDITKLVSVNNVTVSKFDNYSSNYTNNTTVHDYLSNTWVSSLNSKYSSMLEYDNLYNGNISNGSSYKNGINSSFKTKVGIPSVGEMFSSWINENNSLGDSFCIANNVTNGKVATINSNNSLIETNVFELVGVKVTINLKSNVVISSGIGTITSPFQITAQ